MQGFITKIISNDYFVYNIEDKKTYTCKARGIFKDKNITPLCGDNVIFNYDEDSGFSLIVDILPRKNYLIRPAIANIDMALIVMSTIKPKFDSYLVDKLIANISLEKIEPVLIVNKSEFMDEKLPILLDNYRKAGYIVLEVSAKEKTNMDKLHELIKEKKVVLCGQSAVGKSSLINALLDDDSRLIGSYSEKLGRGRHETRVVEFLESNEAFIADTPGFSSLEIKEDLKIIARIFKDFDKYSCNCKFNTCLHKDEPNCGVKDAVKQGIINKERYENYLHLINEIKDGKKVWQKK